MLVDVLPPGPLQFEVSKYSGKLEAAVFKCLKRSDTVGVLNLCHKSKEIAYANASYSRGY